MNPFDFADPLKNPDSNFCFFIVDAICGITILCLPATKFMVLILRYAFRLRYYYNSVIEFREESRDYGL